MDGKPRYTNNPTGTKVRARHLHQHSGMLNRNGMKKEARAIADFPALTLSGRPVGVFNVQAYCDTDFLNFNATLSGAPSYEVPQLPPDRRGQVPHRSAVIVTIGESKSITTMSTLDKINTVQVILFAPGFDNTGALGGAAVLSQMINGAQSVGLATDLYAAPKFKMDVLVKHAGAAETLHFGFSPQDSSFQAFATSCKQLQPGQERDPDLVLMDRTEDAAKLLKPEEALKLRGFIDTFETALKANDQLALNEAPTHVNDLSFFGPGKRCTPQDKRSCDAVDAIRDVTDAMTISRQTADSKKKADKIADSTLIPANTKIQLVFPDQIDISSGARNEPITAHLAAPIMRSGSTLIEQGAIVVLSASALGVPAAKIMGTIQSIVREGTPIPISATKCFVNLTTDTTDSSSQRPSRAPGQPPFRPAPRRETLSSHIPAGSVCSVETGPAVMRR